MPLPIPKPNSADIGLVGLAVMGQNLALNIADHGFKIAVYNRTTSHTESFIAANPPSVFGTTGGALVPAADIKDFVNSITPPRRIIILVKAGGPTDAVIDSLTPYLGKGDVVIDGGNAEWTDTVRREKALAEKGLLFIGSGVSGGEEGARFGPSLMPGGKPESWQLLKSVWEAIAAKVDPKTGKPLTGAAPGKPITGGVPCTAYIGPGGAGHYVKMVHNGIEYADMQLICEAYAFLRDVLHMHNSEMAGTFSQWNSGDLDSFLIEITADILRQKDPVSGKDFVDVVLDAAGQKGTGKWTSSSALDLNVPAPTITEAVYARLISAMKEERLAASRILKAPETPSIHMAAAQSIGHHAAPGEEQVNWIDAVRDALYCSKICAYAQGFALIGAASTANNWNLNFGTLAQIWRGGCIIRARFLQKITDAFARNPKLTNLLIDPYFAGAVEKAQNNWRKVVARAAVTGVPIPAFASALSYFDSYRSPNLTANLLQAQRDYFGAHTYERVDQPRGTFFHLDWPDPKRPQVKA